MGAGANVDAVDDFGQTLLGKAAALGGHEDMVKLLFDSGAEWRSFPKEPTLTYTHRLLMQSWFPGNAKTCAVDAAPEINMLREPLRESVGEWLQLVLLQKNTDRFLI